MLAKGDATAGSIAVVVREFAEERLLAAVFGSSGGYEWVEMARGDSIAPWVERARRNDPDLWIIELDIPDAARFVAETLGDD